MHDHYHHSLGVAIALQEKLLEPKYSNEKPDELFLKSFAQVVGNRWQSLASLLSFTAIEADMIKREKEKFSQANQALYMLRKWILREDATFSYLVSCLKTASLLG